MSNTSIDLDNSQPIFTTIDSLNLTGNDSQLLLSIQTKSNLSLFQIDSHSSEPLIHTYVVCANRSHLGFSAIQQLSLQVSDRS